MKHIVRLNFFHQVFNFIVFCQLFLFKATYTQDSTFYFYDSSLVPIEREYPNEIGSGLETKHSHSLSDSSGVSGLMPLVIHGEKSFRIDASNQSNISQGLRLNVHGRIDSNIYLEARLSDQDRPLELQEQSGTLKEFDDVFVKLKHDNGSLELGDVESKFNIGLRGQWEQSMRGLVLQTNFKPSLEFESRSQFTLGSSKLAYERLTLLTKEGQQGGYVITSSQGDILKVKPGTEKVWLDGVKLEVFKDYEIDYFEGILHFTSSRLMAENQLVEIEFENWNSQSLQSYIGFSQELISSKHTIGAWDFQVESKNDLEGLNKIFYLTNNEQIDSLKSGTVQVYQLINGIYQFVKKENYQIGDTLYQKNFHVNVQGEYRVVEQFDEDYYEFVGPGLGFFSPEELDGQKQNQNKKWRWSGLNYSWTPNEFIYFDTEVDHTSIVDTNQNKNGASRYYFKMGNHRDTQIGSKVPLVLELTSTYKEPEFEALTPTINSYELWDIWHISQKNETENLSLHQGQLIFNPNRFWQHSIEVQNLQIIDSNKQFNSKRWELETLAKMSWLDLKMNQYGMHQHNDITDSIEYEEWGYQLQKDFKTNNWTPTLGTQVERRRDDSTFWEERLFAKLGFQNLIFNNLRHSQKIGGELRKVFEGNYGSARDSLKSIELQHDLSLSNDQGYQFQEYTRWRQSELTWLTGQDFIFWNSQWTQSLWSNQSPIEGSLHYEVESTQENHLIPLYKSVPDGTGDVVYDSIVDNYIHNVDRGDFKLLGFGRDSNASNLFLRKVKTNIHLRSVLSNLLGIKKGFFAYSRVGLQVDLSTADSSDSHRWLPEYNESNFNQLYDASIERTLYYVLEKDKNRFSIESNQLHSKTNGFASANSSLIKYELGGRYFVLPIVSIQPKYINQSQHQDGSGFWKFDQWIPMIEYEFYSYFYLTPFLSIKKGEYSKSQESLQFYSQAEGLKFRYQRSNLGLSSFEFKRVKLNTGEYPYELSNGYAPGENFEFKNYSSIRFGQWFYIDSDFLMVWGQNQKTWSRLMLSARAVF